MFRKPEWNVEYISGRDFLTDRVIFVNFKAGLFVFAADRLEGIWGWKSGKTTSSLF